MAASMTPILLFGMALLACAFFRPGSKLAWSPRLGGWHKLFGVVAFILALLIVLNPELLALGLLGDTAFFDLLVLLLSLQLQTFATRGWHAICAVLSKTSRVMVPRLSRSFALAVLAFAPLGEVCATIQKAVHRISS
jgi:hypothetical protein